MNLIIMPLKKIAKLLFNRIFYVAVALLLQLVWVFLFVWELAGYSQYISLAITVLSIVMVLWILNKRINPSYRLGWTMLIMAFPVFGLLLYLLFGHSRILEKCRNVIPGSRRTVFLSSVRSPGLQENTGGGSVCGSQSEYICRHSVYPVHEHTKAEYFQVGDDMFPVLVKELEQAEHYIYIEYFIINDGVMWRTILDILEQKAAQKWMAA